MKTIGRIVEIIVAIAAFAAGLAFIFERFEKSSHKPFGIYEKYIKRPLDAFLATGALIVLSPILLITAVLVRIKLGGPILFTQDRPGRDGKIFKLYKFRTMLPPKDGVIDPAQDAARLTSFGKKLRSTSLDELPELINMIKGDMAVVGPRPLLTQYLTRYNAHQARRHEVRPGFTGLAQVNGRNASKWAIIVFSILIALTLLGNALSKIKLPEKVYIGTIAEEQKQEEDLTENAGEQPSLN